MGLLPEKSTAQLAYEAYAGALAVDVMAWNELPAEHQNGFHAAVNAVQRAHYSQDCGPHVLHAAVVKLRDAQAELAGHVDRLAPLAP